MALRLGKSINNWFACILCNNPPNSYLSNLFWNEATISEGNHDNGFYRIRNHDFWTCPRVSSIGLSKRKRIQLNIGVEGFLQLLFSYVLKIK